jgi:hypothetical protein
MENCNNGDGDSMFSLSTGTPVENGVDEDIRCSETSPDRNSSRSSLSLDTPVEKTCVREEDENIGVGDGDGNSGGGDGDGDRSIGVARIQKFIRCDPQTASLSTDTHEVNVRIRYPFKLQPEPGMLLSLKSASYSSSSVQLFIYVRKSADAPVQETVCQINGDLAETDCLFVPESISLPVSDIGVSSEVKNVLGILNFTRHNGKKFTMLNIEDKAFYMSDDEKRMQNICYFEKEMRDAWAIDGKIYTVVHCSFYVREDRYVSNPGWRIVPNHQASMFLFRSRSASPDGMHHFFYRKNSEIAYLVSYPYATATDFDVSCLINEGIWDDCEIRVSKEGDIFVTSPKCPEQVIQVHKSGQFKKFCLPSVSFNSHFALAEKAGCIDVVTIDPDQRLIRWPIRPREPPKVSVAEMELRWGSSFTFKGSDGSLDVHKGYLMKNCQKLEELFTSVWEGQTEAEIQVSGKDGLVTASVSALRAVTKHIYSSGAFLPLDSDTSNVAELRRAFGDPEQPVDDRKVLEAFVLAKRWCLTELAATYAAYIRDTFNGENWMYR